MRNKEYELARQVLTLANQIVKNRNKHLKELYITAEQADSLTFFCFNYKSFTKHQIVFYANIQHDVYL